MISTMDYVNLTIGSLGLVVTAAFILWQVLTHRQSKAEKADAKLSWNIGPQGQFLCVTVVNTGELPLHVRQVELVVKHVEREQLSANRRTSVPVATSMQFQPRNGQSGPLLPGEDRVYVYPEGAAQKLYSAQDPNSVESVWVSVKTPRREVCRIDRSEVLPFLQRTTEHKKETETNA